MRRMQRELREMKERQKKKKERAVSAGACVRGLGSVRLGWSGEERSVGHAKYRRPGKIVNRGLVLANMSMYLKPNLVEHHEFEAVSAAVWKHLYSWYTADMSIVRNVRKDRSNRNRTFLDLYPGIVF